ncbi:TIGR03085 family protein [Arthrobacter sp. UNCCL28]|nr:TIGR03085 family protein [Arthrobacter sp. UNCCL28]
MLVSQVMHFVDPSREVLAETLLAAGPDSPTLCAGWQTRDLAAHLYLRERKIAVGLGLLIPSLGKASEKATSKLAAKLKSPEAYAELIKTFRGGPPALSPLKIKALDETSNLIEYFVHTEDIRRAGDRWAPRALDEAYSDALWDDLIKRAAFLYRGVDLGIVLVRPTGPRHVAKRAPVSVAIVGEPGELLMHAHGRTSQALVTFEGQPDAVALLQSADIGL